jgi:regulator of protease activity HflC (stomatin/prohibitin superfamily)
VSAVARWSVSDPVHYTAVADPAAVVYPAVQVALGEQLASREADEIVRAAREDVTAAVVAAAQAAGSEVGITVAEVVIKDIILPAELRAAYAELVTVRQRAQAQLETARAETAALRSMANSAKLLDDHPALARLRMIQAAAYGTKIILGQPEPTSAPSG